MQRKKPKWGKPKLIVLVRGERQEEVLIGCKADIAAGDSEKSDIACRSIALDCSICSTIATS